MANTPLDARSTSVTLLASSRSMLSATATSSSSAASSPMPLLRSLRRSRAQLSHLDFASVQIAPIRDTGYPDGRGIGAQRSRIHSGRIERSSAALDATGVRTWRIGRQRGHTLRRSISNRSDLPPEDERHDRHERRSSSKRAPSTEPMIPMRTRSMSSERTSYERYEESSAIPSLAGSSRISLCVSDIRIASPASPTIKRPTTERCGMPASQFTRGAWPVPLRSSCRSTLLTASASSESRCGHVYPTTFRAVSNGSRSNHQTTASRRAVPCSLTPLDAVSWQEALAITTSAGSTRWCRCIGS